MSPRLIALTILTMAGLALAGPALAETAASTDTAQQAADTATQTVETEADTVEQAAEQSMDTAATDASSAVETTAGDAETSAKEAADEAEGTAEAATDAVENTSEATAEKVEEAAETATDTTEAAADSATDAVDSAAETTEETAETAADAADATTGEAADTAEAAVEEVAEEAEKGVEDAAEAAADDVEEVAEDAEKADEEAMNLEQTQADEAAAETEPVAAQDEQPTDAGVQAKVAACAACHGADGNSVIPENPKLAGQVPGFIADQLAKFKSGERENAIMAAQVANLTDEDMKELDNFFSSQQTQLGSISEEMIPLADQGERIYRGGQIELSISACMSCHGPTGDGIPIRFPRVSGQHMQYLETQLLAYKTGTRVSDIMNPIAFRLSEQQIKALAAYMHALK